MSEKDNPTPFPEMPEMVELGENGIIYREEWVLWYCQVTGVTEKEAKLKASQIAEGITSVRAKALKGLLDKVHLSSRGFGDVSFVNEPGLAIIREQQGLTVNSLEQNNPNEKPNDSQVVDLFRDEVHKFLRGLGIDPLEVNITTFIWNALSELKPGLTVDRFCKGFSCDHDGKIFKLSHAVKVENFRMFRKEWEAGKFDHKQD